LDVERCPWPSFLLHPSSFILAILLLSPPTLAQPTPTSKPTTHLATTRLAGEDNPRRTLTVYAVAMAAGDADRVRNSYWAETPDEKAVVDAYAHLATSVGALRKAATDRYGPDGFDNIGFGKMFADQIKALEATRLFVDGPKALVFVNKDDKPDLRLVRVESGWKISATSFSNPARQAVRIDAQASAYDDLAREIAAGKYRLATDARAAGSVKVRQAKEAAEAKLKAAAATQPGAAGSSSPIPSPGTPGEGQGEGSAQHPTESQGTPSGK
jgi:hypothetical protein